MRAAIYNPYLDSLGGGERYSMAVASSLFKLGYKVDVEWGDISIKNKLEKRFGVDLQKINFVKNVNRGDLYEVIFWVSDGSIPLLRARNNILHFQIPFTNVGGRSLLNKMKFIRIKNIVCNSEFTKRFIDEEYGIKSKVIYPPVDILNIKPKRKENLIISVGRFSQLTQAKRQDVLVKAFKKMCDKGLENWRFVLAGGVDVGVGSFLRKLRRLAGNYPIEILESPDYKKIKDLFGRAKIFWSASGYGIDEEKESKKVEHFGISVIEAMAAKTVPIVLNSGGHKEIILDSDNGLLWETMGQLVSKTQKLINDRDLFKAISLQAQKDSKKYSYEVFKKNINKII